MNNEVTAIICNRDEPSLIDSYNSVKDCVDKAIIMDCSKDRTMARSLEELNDPKLRVFYVPMNYRIQNYLAYSIIDTRWVLRWDSDFIARDIDKLLDKTDLKGNLAISCCVYQETPRSLLNDIYHKEVYLFTRSDELFKNHLLRLYTKSMGTRYACPWLPFPLSYKQINTDIVIAEHLTTKPKWRYDEKTRQIELSRGKNRLEL